MENMLIMLLVKDARLRRDAVALLFNSRKQRHSSNIKIVPKMPSLLNGTGLLITVGLADDEIHRAAALAANSAGKANSSLRFEEEGFEIGPLNIPGWCACLDCYLQRLAPEVPLAGVHDSSTGTYRGTQLTPTPELPVFRLGMAALLTQIGPAPASGPTLARVDRCRVPGLHWEHHWVDQVPGCPTCHVGKRAANASS